MAQFQRLDLTNKIFGKLTAVSYVGKNKNEKTVWLCKCECGKEPLVTTACLTKGSTKSCGCNRIKHGLSHTQLHSTWYGMKNRCYKPTDSRYSTYGARGINICTEWLNSFITFKDWALSNGFEKGLTIERININGNYGPENCKWIPMNEQAGNKTNTHRIEIDGIIYNPRQLGEKYNLNPRTISARIRNGLKGEQIIAPIKEKFIKMWVTINNKKK